jgi:predicted Zn-dependent peptidase
VPSAFPTRSWTAAVVAASFALAPRVECQPSDAPLGIEELEARVEARTLPNGLRVLFLERRGAPVASFHTYIGSGSAQERPGEGGLAHVFEHLAGAGVGDGEAPLEPTETSDVDRNGMDSDPAVRDYARTIAQFGGDEVRAEASTDALEVAVSMPAERFPLWAYLESERLREPSLRDFAAVRDLAIEERRRRIDANPAGALLESFLAAAFPTHPYGRPVVGSASDLAELTVEDAQAFARAHFVPRNVVIAIVGDLPAADVFPLVESRFGALAAGDPPRPVASDESTGESGERRVTLDAEANPIVVVGWRRPAATHPDDAALEAVAGLLGVGRDSRLQRALVRDRSLAASVSAWGAYPGRRYPTLLVVMASASPGRSAEELESAIHEEAERLGVEGVAEDELEPVRTRAVAAAIRSAATNAGLASALARAEGLEGSYREFFRRLERLQSVTAERVRETAARTFLADRRTVAVLRGPAAADGDR